MERLILKNLTNKESSLVVKKLPQAFILNASEDDDFASVVLTNTQAKELSDWLNNQLQ